MFSFLLSIIRALYTVLLDIKTSHATDHVTVLDSINSIALSNLVRFKNPSFLTEISSMKGDLK